MPDTTPRVDMHAMAWLTCDVVNSGRIPRSCATAPATWGHAIDVPDLVADESSLPTSAAKTEDPGAKTSTHGP